jgi:hypothetical protein
MLPGNTANVTVVQPIVDRLRRRFGIGRVWVVADRGMISAKTVAGFEAPGLDYILGAGERTDKMVWQIVLDDSCARDRTAAGRDPALRQEVKHAGTRYIVCRNETEAANDRAVRKAIVAAPPPARPQGADRQCWIPALSAKDRRAERSAGLRDRPRGAGRGGALLPRHPRMESAIARPRLPAATALSQSQGRLARPHQRLARPRRRLSPRRHRPAARDTAAQTRPKKGATAPGVAPGQPEFRQKRPNISGLAKQSVEVELGHSIELASLPFI